MPSPHRQDEVNPPRRDMKIAVVIVLIIQDVHDESRFGAGRSDASLNQSKGR